VLKKISLQMLLCVIFFSLHATIPLKSASFSQGFDGTLDAFATMLNDATIAALVRHHQTIPEEVYKEALEDQCHQASHATRIALAVKAHVPGKTLLPLWRSASSLLIAFLKFINPFSKTPSAGTFKPVIDTGAAAGPWFQSLAAYTRARMTKPEKKTADFVAIFELLEKIAQLQKSPSFLERVGLKPPEAMKPPIVIIREIQHLEHLTDAPELGRQVFSRLFEYFEPYKQGQRHIPVIIETSDFLWVRMKQILSSQESFLATQMGPWQREEAEEWLVRCTLEGQPAPVFTPEEFNKVS
jgi:hypothetical protein